MSIMSLEQTRKNQKTILSVDDDQSCLELLSAVIKFAGHNFIGVENGLEAMEVLRTRNVDLVVLDVMMPHMDGLEAIIKIRGLIPSVPIIFLTVWDDLKVRGLAKQSGAFDYFLKPFNIEEFLARINQAFPAQEQRSINDVIGKVFKIKTFFEAFAKELTPLNFFSRFPSFVQMGLIVPLVIIAWTFLSSYFQSKPQSQNQNIQETKELPLNFRLPYPNPSGITWDGTSLWISDWSTQTIYKHRTDANLTLEKYFPITDNPAMNLTWGGSILWTVGQDHKIRKHSLDDRLTVISEVKIPNAQPSALAWDGKNLWSCDAQSRKIYRHLPDENLTVIAMYNFPGQYPVGMAWMGRYLWIADEVSSSIYSLKFDEEIFTVIEILRPEAHKSGRNKLSGLCSDGKNLWTISEAKGLIFRNPL